MDKKKQRLDFGPLIKRFVEATYGYPDLLQQAQDLADQEGRGPLSKADKGRLRTSTREFLTNSRDG